MADRRKQPTNEVFVNDVRHYHIPEAIGCSLDRRVGEKERRKREWGFPKGKVDRRQPDPPAAEPPVESDGPCRDCGQPCLHWFAPNDVWNKVVPERAGLLCPNCFIRRARRSMPDTFWVVGIAEARVYGADSGRESQPSAPKYPTVLTEGMAKSITRAHERSEEVIASLRAALSVAQAERNAGGFCEKHAPNKSRAYDSCWVCSRLEESEALARCQEALRRLLDKMDLVENSEEYKAVWFSAQLHRGPYAGGQWEKEREAARAALTPSQPQQEGKS